MKKKFILVAVIAVCAILFAFVNKPEKQKLEYKWFKYRTGETGVPVADRYSAKNASNYVLAGEERYCDGNNGYCGIFAQTSDATGSVLPIISEEEEEEINLFFDNPDSYYGMLIDQKN